MAKCILISKEYQRVVFLFLLMIYAVDMQSNLNIISLGFWWFFYDLCSEDMPMQSNLNRISLGHVSFFILFCLNSKWLQLHQCQNSCFYTILVNFCFTCQNVECSLDSSLQHNMAHAKTNSFQGICSVHLNLQNYPRKLLAGF